MKSTPFQMLRHRRATTATEAAEAGDLVLVTVPLKAYQQVPVKPLAGKVVLDTTTTTPTAADASPNWTRRRPQPASSCRPTSPNPAS